MSHSTYDALRNQLDVSDGMRGLGRVYTAVAARVLAAGVAAIAAVRAIDQLIIYFGLNPQPRLRLDAQVLPAIKSLFLRAVEENANIGEFEGA